MTAETRQKVILGSCAVGVLLEVFAVKSIMPERGFIDLFFCGFFAHIIVIPVVFCLMDKILPQPRVETKRHEDELGSQKEETPGEAQCAESQTDEAEDDEEYAAAFEEWLREEERRKQIAQQRSEQKRMLRYIFSMMAKVAKADGKVVREEIEAAQRVFGSLDFANAFHDFCVKVFNAAKDNKQSVYWYAAELTKLGGSIQSRYFVYELLWDVACADGVLAKAEKEILKVICGYLQLPFSAYGKAYAWRMALEDVEDEELPSGRNSEMTISAAYELFGCDEQSTDMDVKRAYRETAKRYHPDILRAANVPEDLIAIANAKMVKLNEAWELIRHDRGI